MQAMNRALLSLFASLTALCIVSAAEFRPTTLTAGSSAQDISQPTGSRTNTIEDLDAAGLKVLVFSRTTGYRHASITNGILAVRELGTQHGFVVDATEDPHAFTGTNLARYQVVVFLSVTGEVLGPAEKDAFRNYILSGGGVAAVHGAVFGPLACEEKWGWYGELFCCAFTNHSSIVPATLVIEDAASPSTGGLPELWRRVDEWYNFTGTPRNCAHVLLRIDESSYTGGKMGRDHPLAWCRRFGQGRMWYTALGHTESSFSEPLFRRHLLGGIVTAAGRVRADFVPNAAPLSTRTEF
jgi:type 1 glutamine amidotransferase